MIEDTVEKTRPAEPRGARGGATWNRRATGRFARACFAVLPVWTALDMLTSSRGPTGLHAVFDLPFVFLCHRIPERVLSIFGAPMPMCSRCAGLWFGLSIAALFAWPAVPIKALRVVAPVAMALMLAEILTQDLGWHPVFHPTRILTGLLVGVPIGGGIGALIERELGGSAKGSSTTSP